MADRGSVFARLVAAMLAMGGCLLVLVTMFFWVSVGPDFNTLVYRLAAEYSGAVVATSPDLNAARRMVASGDVRVRYEGPSGSWATAHDMPSVDDVRSGRVRDGQLLLQPRYFLFPAPQGGTYLFVWNFSERMQVTHAILLLLLLLVIVAVVLTTHAVLRRLLRPLRMLSDGVARLSEGQLDVTLPNGRRDEFGRLTAAFNSMVGRVREMIRARDQLLVDVSHELRSPLTRMKVALALPPTDEQRSRLADDVAEMERMVAELLELERLRSGRGLRIASQDLVRILGDVVADYRDRPPGVRLVTPSTAIPVAVDVEKFRTVLRNLLDNAVKYSMPQSRPVEVSAVQRGGTAEVRVTDDGVGIPDRDIDRVFEPFFRVDASRSKSTGGYGLGLSICKRVMEAHGGSIAVERARDRGTSFVLTLLVTERAARDDSRSVVGTLSAAES